MLLLVIDNPNEYFAINWKILIFFWLIYKNFLHCSLMIIWRPPSLSDLTPMLFNMEWTYLGSTEASIYIKVPIFNIKCIYCNLTSWILILFHVSHEYSCHILYSCDSHIILLLTIFTYKHLELLALNIWGKIGLILYWIAGGCLSPQFLGKVYSSFKGIYNKNHGFFISN